MSLYSLLLISRNPFYQAMDLSDSDIIQLLFIILFNIFLIKYIYYIFSYLCFVYEHLDV